MVTLQVCFAWHSPGTQLAQCERITSVPTHQCMHVSPRQLACNGRSVDCKGENRPCMHAFNHAKIGKGMLFG